MAAVLLPGSIALFAAAIRKRAERRDADGVLILDQRARLELIVGSTTETITVEGSAPLLNTSDASVSMLVCNQCVETCP